MTAVVGILCSDGAVVGTDSSVTMGNDIGIRTIEQPTEKLGLVANKIIIAGTGSVGMGQRFKNVAEKMWRDGGFAANSNNGLTSVDVCRNLSSKTVEDFSATDAPRTDYGALIAAPVDRCPVLCEFSLKGFQPTLFDKAMWFGSMGSGQHIRDPFLALMREIFWPNGPPTISQAVLAVTWALDHAIAVNPGGVNGPARIAVLDKSGKKGDFCAHFLSDTDMDAHRTWIAEAKTTLADSLPTPGESVPEVPRMPKSG